MAMHENYKISSEDSSENIAQKLRLKYVTPSISSTRLSAVIAGVAGSQLDDDGSAQTTGGGSTRQRGKRG